MENEAKEAILIPDEFKDGKFLSVKSGDKFIIIMDEKLPPNIVNKLKTWLNEFKIKAMVIRGRLDSIPPVIAYKLKED